MQPSLENFKIRNKIWTNKYEKRFIKTSNALKLIQNISHGGDS